MEASAPNGDGPLRVHVVARSLGRAQGVAEQLDHAGFGVDVWIVQETPAKRADAQPANVLVLCDIQRLPDVREIVRLDQGARVVVVGRSLQVADVRRLLEAGADGIVDADDGLDVLPDVVRVTASGGLCLPGRMREVVRPVALSTRERQVLALMASGLSNQEIAEQMFLSENTVKSHTASAFRRLGVHSRREAVALVLGSDETLRRTVLMSHPLEAPHRMEQRREDGPQRSGGGARSQPPRRFP